MSTLKQDLKRKSDGRWDEVDIEFKGAKATMKVLATSPYVLRLQFDAPEEVKIKKR